jgi:hypothetical protein
LGPKGDLSGPLGDPIGVLRGPIEALRELFKVLRGPHRGPYPLAPSLYIYPKYISA